MVRLNVAFPVVFRVARPHMIDRLSHRLAFLRHRHDIHLYLCYGSVIGLTYLPHDLELTYIFFFEANQYCRGLADVVDLGYDCLSMLANLTGEFLTQLWLPKRNPKNDSPR